MGGVINWLLVAILCVYPDVVLCESCVGYAALSRLVGGLLLHVVLVLLKTLNVLSSAHY